MATCVSLLINNGSGSGLDNNILDLLSKKVGIMETEQLNAHADTKIYFIGI